MPSSSLIHLAFHKVDEVLLTPELFLLLLKEKESLGNHKALLLGY